jgi:hypothetical protein
MKVPHAAALALAGWYLIVPPSLAETGWVCGNSASAVLSREWFGWGKGCHILDRTVDLDAPLSEWHEANPFETLAGCQSALAEGQRVSSDWAEPIHSALCIASDDPRLKGK